MSAGDPASSDEGLGVAFARALAGKQFARVERLLDPAIDFRGLTPNRVWEASTAAEVVQSVLLSWFEDSDVIDELVEVESAAVADRARVGYRLRGHNDDGPFVVEQQAYYSARDGRIDWMRVVCSGMRAPSP